MVTKMENNTAKKKFNVVDILIVAVLILAAVGIALRMLLIKNTPDPMTLPDVALQEYTVSYIIREQREGVADYLADGQVFRFALTNKVFGTTFGNPSLDDADKHYFDKNGNYITVQNTADRSEDGKDISHLKRYDITGQFTVQGKLTADTGVLVINGAETETIALNKPVYIRSDELIITIYVTSIDPVQ